MLDEFGQTIDATALAFDSDGNLYALKTGTTPARSGLEIVGPCGAPPIPENLPATGLPARALLALALIVSASLLARRVERPTARG